MQFSDFYYPSSTGCNTIHARKLIPDGKITGVIQIAHGIREHIARYDAFMAYLSSHGFVVCGNDHLGHGKSVRSPSETGFFAEKDGWNRVVDDMLSLHDNMKAEFPTVPYILFGHSMGSFLARTYMIDHPDAYDLCILSGTAHQNSLLLKGGKLLTELTVLVKGADGDGTQLESLVFKDYNAHIEQPKTDYDWLSRDDSYVATYVNDEMCGIPCKNSVYRDMLQGLNIITNSKNIGKMNPEHPVLFISGTEDPVGDYGKGVRKAYEAFSKAGLTDLTIKLYPGARHGMLNETNRTEVYKDISDWIEARI